MNYRYKLNIGIMAFAYLCTAFVSCKNEDLSDVSEAKFPEKIEFVFPDEIKQLIYKDELGNSNLPLLKGESVTLGYTIYPDDVTFQDVNWTSSNESVATISNEGVLKAIEGDGSTFSVIQVAPVGAYSGSGIYGTLKVVVSNSMIKAESINITAPSVEVYAGETLQLTTSIFPENSTYKTVKWSSSDESIAIVDENGLVTGLDNDNTTSRVVITATTLDGSNVSSSFDITVKQAVHPQEISINQEYSYDEGYVFAIAENTVTLNYETVPEESTASLIKWESSDETIATVENGIVTFNQDGKFGDVVITATCPQTGNSSNIKLHIEEGLIRELFHDENNYTWSDAKQSGGGTSTSTEWHDGYVTVTTYNQNTTNQRGDFKCWCPKVWLNIGIYPLIAIRWEDVLHKYSNEGVSKRQINLDTSGICNGVKYSGNVGGDNNKWLHEYKCSDGTYVYVYDLTQQSFKTGGLLPANSLAEFTTFQFKYADISPISHQLTYDVHWVQTFKTLEDIEDYITSEDLTFEKIK